MSDVTVSYEGAPYLVLTRGLYRSRKAHIERHGGWDRTLCGLDINGVTHRSDEPVCLRCSTIADSFDGVGGGFR